jgi:hypothetical protein
MYTPNVVSMSSRIFKKKFNFEFFGAPLEPSGAATGRRWNTLSVFFVWFSLLS